MTGFWADLPAGRAVHVRGGSPEAIELTLDPLLEGAPAVIPCAASVATDPAKTVTAILAELEEAAIGLYPAWLPGAEGLDGRQGARVAAVRALALQKGAATSQFGPFLADLAERSLDGSAGVSAAGRYAAAVRAAGIARVIADSYGRSHTALLLPFPDGLTANEARALAAACEWLASHGGFSAWLVGDGVDGVDWLPTVEIRLPAPVRDLCGSATSIPVPEPDRTVVRCPPLSGRPAPGSAAELALEAALATRSWAEGRVWNRTFQTDPLAEQIRVDLMWERERCAVELDGPEHRTPLHYEADRRRDVLLQLAGFAVLRFTNEQVAHDLATVLSHIEQLVDSRRNGRA